MDLNNDGHADILSGSYSRQSQPMAGLFQVLWGNGNGVFKKAAVLNGTDQKPLIIPLPEPGAMTENICTRPTAADWNGDGKLDLVVGNFAGGFYLFTGEGKGRFNPKPERMMATNQPLKVNGAHSDPFVIDWDADGDLDILSGSSSGGVQWAENTAGKGNPPKLRPFASLIKSPGRHSHGNLLSEKDLTAPASDSRIWVDDVNGDGKLDILLGDNVTLVSTAKGISEKAFQQRFKDWSKEIQKASQSLGDGRDQKAMTRYRALYQEREQFMTEDRTGYVWLYLQK